MRAKVKITVIDTAQEYLLLVAKMNLKGVLVNTPQMLKPNTQLMLELKLNENEPILIKGYVHKVSDSSSSKKGMVIAFVNPTEDLKKKIQKFIDDSKDASSSEESSSPKQVPPPQAKKKVKWPIGKKSAPAEETRRAEPEEDLIEPNKTMVVGEDDLPSLSLSSPDNRNALSVATMDEESLHAYNPGMAGSTRHVNIDQRGQIKKSTETKKPFRLSTIYKAFIFVILIIVVVLAAKPVMKIMDERFGRRIVLPGTTQNSGQTTTTTKQNDTPTTTTGVAAGLLEVIQVDDQGSFVKISLLGKGNFANNVISKATGPNSIHIDLPEITESKVAVMTVVNNNPISKISSAKGKNVSVDILYLGATAPNYEAKVFNGGLDIFIYR